MRFLWILVVAGMFSGCSSEVDKCVESYMSARIIKNERLKKEAAEWEELKNKNDKNQLDEMRLKYWNPIVDNESKEEAEARFRYACLNAAGKK